MCLINDVRLYTPHPNFRFAAEPISMHDFTQDRSKNRYESNTLIKARFLGGRAEERLRTCS